jgi:hypothetical protein
VPVPVVPEKPPPKKARSKSPSPDYPPIEAFTEEQLLRPNEPYARLIYDILDEIHPKALPLKQIYRALKLKFPFFVHKVESEGWQSSVRHNLNQEWNKLFDKGEKEGKGFAWKSIPGALQPQAERKRANPPAPPRPRPPPVPRQNMPQGTNPTINWQNHVPYPQNGVPPQRNGTGSNGMPWGAPPLNGPFPPSQAGRPAQMPNQGQYLPAGQQLSQYASTSASRNMPCTLDGLVTIRMFEKNFIGSTRPDRVHEIRSIFSRAKDRLLHGRFPASPSAPTAEEQAILQYMRGIIQLFRNPTFVGFHTPAPRPPPMAPAPSQSPRPATSTPLLQQAPPATPGQPGPRLSQPIVSTLSQQQTPPTAPDQNGHGPPSALIVAPAPAATPPA